MNGGICTYLVVVLLFAPPPNGILAKDSLSCTDKTLHPSFCAIHKEQGHCKWQYVADNCAQTCDLCDNLNTWGSWNSWSKCSKNCDGSKRLRTRSCASLDCHGIKYDVEDCPSDFCSSNTLSTDKKAVGRSRSMLPMGRKALSSPVSDSTAPVHTCGDNQFLCDTSRCLDISKNCNGYYECSDRSDEEYCPLGLRWDPLRVIMNWETHTCWDVNVTESGESVPWSFRRCPGQVSRKLDNFWWQWRLEYNIRHEFTGLCLAVNKAGPNSTEVVVKLKPCDILDYTQRWQCDNPTNRVMLEDPEKVMPEDKVNEKYLAISKEGPGLYFGMTSVFSRQTTDFHILETDRLHICSKRGGGAVGILTPVECSRHCGGGTKQVLRACAKYGRTYCKGSDYRIVQCNTHPCPQYCLPSWHYVSSSLHKPDVNCFKAFRERKTFLEAQAYCAANNWTLVALKNLEVINNVKLLQWFTTKSYVGVYEEMDTSQSGTFDHSLRYVSDGQPVGETNPWTRAGIRKGNEDAGCALGLGGTYYGNVDATHDDVPCEQWASPGSNVKEHTRPKASGLLYPPKENDHSCRNPNLDSMGVWCYATKRRVPSPCDVDDCLDISGPGSSKVFPAIDIEHQFLIRSLWRPENGERHCIAAKQQPDNSISLVVDLCDFSKEEQRFFWWSSFSLVNIAFKECISFSSKSPVHGDILVLSPCQRKLATSSQRWIETQSYVISGWNFNSKKLGSIYKVMFNQTKKVHISEMRNSLFTTWLPEVGIVPVSTMLSRTPPGPYAMLMGCGKCLTQPVALDSNLLQMSPCNKDQSSQRWVLLGDGLLKNLASGLCLATYQMHTYAVVEECERNEHSQVWIWEKESHVGGTYTVMHEMTQFFLRCKCSGLSSVCLTPTPGRGSTSWKFVPEKSQLKPQAWTEFQSIESRGAIGQQFALQNLLNLTQCAKPEVEIGANVNETTNITIVFVPCQIDNSAFLWQLSGVVTQIRHRDLYLCLDSMLDNVEEGKQLRVTLRPCNMTRLKYQSWIFKSAPVFYDETKLKGDYVRSASDKEYYLSTELAETKLGLLHILVVKKETNTDKWEAETAHSNAVGVSEMADCALEWIKMKDYRGSRSWTRDGLRCQPWISMKPHRHPFSQKNLTKFDLSGSSCRRPPGPPTEILDRKSEDHAWCMTLKPDTPWQDCLVPRCPLPAVVVMDTATRTWEATTGEEALPFTCQTRGACYSDRGQSFTGYTHWNGRWWCLNWRLYYNGDTSFPDHNFCRNPTRNLVRPWCWVKKNVAQYCMTIEKCPLHCTFPKAVLRSFKVVSIFYGSAADFYAVQSKIKVVCKKGYNVSTQYILQELVCTEKGEWQHDLIECKRVFCKPPAEITNALLLTVQRRYSFGSVAVYQCSKGYLTAPGKNLVQTTCKDDGTWSEGKHTCLPACPPGWRSFNQSCYSVYSNYTVYTSYADANKRCAQRGGHLAFPQNKIIYDLVRWLIASDKGHANHEYWLGVKDIGASKENLAKRVWQSQDGRLNKHTMYLNTLRQYHVFKIQSLGSILNGEKRFMYTDRCMYGDNETRKVLLQSCSFDNKSGLWWTWLTHGHLYNIDLGLCLHATTFNDSVNDHGIIRNSVFLENCSLDSVNQSFICGPHSGYLLRIRRNSSSNYLVVDPNSLTGEVVVGGKHATGLLSLWASHEDLKFLCHWELKPPDSYFIVHRGLVPSFTSFTFFETHKCLQNRTGATMAVVNDATSNLISQERVGWCGCLYMKRENGSEVNVAPLQDDVCSVAGNSFSSSGLQTCQIEESGDSLCRRTDGSSPSLKPVPDWCVAMLITTKEIHRLEPRFCASRLAGSVCETKAQWHCDAPFQPENSIPVFESGDFASMQFAYGSTITLKCKRGYRFPHPLKTATITCNQFFKWELKKLSGNDELSAYVSDREERENWLYGLKCYRVNCTVPRSVSGMDIQVNSVKGKASYGQKVIFTCKEGTKLRSGDYRHVATCMEDETWQPVLQDLCTTIQCKKPTAMDNALSYSPSLAYNATAKYTCLKGFWLKPGKVEMEVKCNKSAKWDPDPGTTKCLTVTCPAPTSKKLLRMRSQQMAPKRSLIPYKSMLTLRCLPGYWLDRNKFTVVFECQIDGGWSPMAPTMAQCIPVLCPWPNNVPGAIMRGSDRNSGNVIRYACSASHWIRRAFKLFSPHWSQCIYISGGKDPDIVDTHVTVDSPPMEVLMQPDCVGFATERNLWVWHWSFHLKNKYTDTCLTAAALPVLNEDSVHLVVKKCEKGNIYQHWECMKVEDGSNARLLTMRAANFGGFLTTVSDDTSTKTEIKLSVTGNRDATGIESYWVVDKTVETTLDICMYREGFLYEESVCNSFGEWNPNTRHIECSLVDCGQPPNLPHTTMAVTYRPNHKTSASDFSAPNAWEHTELNYKKVSSFAIDTIITYHCNTGKWVEPGNYSFSLVCAATGKWTPYRPNPDDPKVSCVDVVCPAPTILSHSVVSVFPMISINANSKLFGAPIIFSKGVNQTYLPVYGSKAVINCETGYWVLNVFLQSITDSKRAGSREFDAVCNKWGSWTQPVIGEGIDCKKIVCSDPGFIIHATRSPNTTMEALDHGSIFQYQCDKGFWFTFARVYSEIVCTREGLWSPDPEELTCSISSCRNPTPIKFASQSGANLTIGSQVTYTCMPGRKIGGLLSFMMVTCQSDGLWFPPPATIDCELLVCDSLPEIAHSVFQNISQLYKNQYVAGDHVTLTCSVGYAIDTTTSHIDMSCNLDGLWQPELTAESKYMCKPVHCPTPPEVLLSGATHKGGSTLYTNGDTVTYVCPIGKWLGRSGPEHSFTSTCIATPMRVLEKGDLSYATSWEPDVNSYSCFDVECKQPGFVEHSQLSMDTVTYQSTATYTCELGYQIEDGQSDTFSTTMVSKCQSDGNWQPSRGNFSCVATTCDHPRAVENALMTAKDPSEKYYFRETVEYKCRDGMYFVRTTLADKRQYKQSWWIITCGLKGLWDLHPTEINIACQPVTCPSVAVIPFAQIKTDNPGGPASTAFPVGTFFNVSCSYGYVSATSSAKLTSLQCGSTGEWLPFNPVMTGCRRIHCKDPGERMHSSRVVGGVQFLDRVTYFADEGSLNAGLQSIVTLQCNEDGQWLVLNSTETTMQRKKRDLHHAQGSVNMTVGDITFSTLSCGVPYVPENATIVAPETQNYIYESTVVVQCIAGHYIAANTTSLHITCSGSGKWWPNPELIYCLESTQFNCHLPLPPANAVVEIHSYQLDGTATIRCLSSFEMRPGVTTGTTTCVTGSNWNPDPVKNMKCSKIHCHKPPDALFSTLAYTGTQYHSVAHYQCDSGYSFSSVANHTKVSSKCVAHNTWQPNPNQLRCTILDCGPPSLILPKATYLSFSTTTYGSVANYTCDIGFQVAGMNTNLIQALCEKDGLWVFNITQTDVGSGCVRVSCDKPPLIVNGTFALVTGHSYMDSVYYRCLPGYALSQNKTLINETTFSLTCNSHGTWTLIKSQNQTKYTCEPVQCPQLLQKPNSLLSSNQDNETNSVGSTVIYACQSGYSSLWHGDKIILTCMWYGRWEPDPIAITCSPSKCADPPSMLHANTSGDTRIGSVWKYECEVGYEIAVGLNTVSMECSPMAAWVPGFNTLKKCKHLSCWAPDVLPLHSKLYDVHENALNLKGFPRQHFFLTGTTLRVQCDNGYRVKVLNTTSQNIICSPSVRWEPPLIHLADCERVICIAPPLMVKMATSHSIANSVYYYNISVSYSCPHGMFFVNNRKPTITTYCASSGQFEPDPTTLNCTVITCTDHIMPLADQVLLTSRLKGGKTKYQCHVGAWFRPNVTVQVYTCDDQGNWFPSMETTHCRPVSCPYSPIDKSVNNYKIYLKETEVLYGHPLTVVCLFGYKMAGYDRVVCMESGKLQDFTGVCRPVSCGKPNLPPHSVLNGSSFLYQSSVIVKCKDGFWISRGIYSATLVCQANASWSESIGRFQCIPLSCHAPKDVEKGVNSIKNTSYMATYTLTCDTGYWISATKEQSLQMICAKDGMWYPTAPTACRRIVCPVPPKINNALLRWNSNLHMAVAQYSCSSLHSIGENNGTHYVVKGKAKTKQTVCSEKGNWDPIPNIDFICSSIQNKYIPIIATQRRVAGNNTADIVEHLGPPYKRLDMSLPMQWLKFNDKHMSLSDVYESNSSLSHRDIKFTWDNNPLTFWQASYLPNDNKPWLIEAYLGKAKAVFAFMIMCVDDGLSDITSFSLLYVGDNRQLKKAGPFKVYGDSGISGMANMDIDFNIPYTSIATTWVYNDIQAEMLWFQLVIHGTLDPNTPPAIREISILTSEVKWKLMYPVDPTPTLLLSSAILCALFVFLPILYYLHRRMPEIVLEVPPQKRKNRCQYELSFEYQCTPLRDCYYHLMVRVRETERLHAPIVWIRGTDHVYLLSASQGKCIVKLQSFSEEIFSDDVTLDVVGWLLVEDPYVGYARMKETTKFKLQLRSIRLFHVSSGSMWYSSRSKVDISKSPDHLCSVKIQKHRSIWDNKFFKLIQCHLLISLLSSPKNSHLSRIERFLCVMVLNAACMVFTLSFQFLFSALPEVDHDSNMIFGLNLFKSTVNQFGGDEGFVTMAILGTAACIPLILVLRLLYRAAYSICKIKTSSEYLHQFCSHVVFDKTTGLKLPFIKMIKAPLLKLLGISHSDIPQDAVTMVKESYDKNVLFDNTCWDLKRRWSYPDLVTDTGTESVQSYSVVKQKSSITSSSNELMTQLHEISQGSSVENANYSVHKITSQESLDEIESCSTESNIKQQEPSVSSLNSSKTVERIPDIDQDSGNPSKEDSITETGWNLTGVPSQFSVETMTSTISSFNLANDKMNQSDHEIDHLSTASKLHVCEKPTLEKVFPQKMLNSIDSFNNIEEEKQNLGVRSPQTIADTFATDKQKVHKLEIADIDETSQKGFKRKKHFDYDAPTLVEVYSVSTLHNHNTTYGHASIKDRSSDEALNFTHDALLVDNQKHGAASIKHDTPTVPLPSAKTEPKTSIFRTSLFESEQSDVMINGGTSPVAAKELDNQVAAPVCSQKSKLHHSIVTHAHVGKRLCPTSISPPSLLSWCLGVVVVACCLYLMLLGQYVNSNSKHDVYKAAIIALSSTYVIVMFIDAVVAMYLFNEQHLGYKCA